ncbi:MAG TPA: hypothetical protein VFX86_04900 [Candidatus Saccharimonadales bacterium]|nr:hypothetical protein [Candidatus Saccharimonadales bacterium]
MVGTEVREEAAFIFSEAASYIRQYGWRVSGMNKHGMPRCSMGALASAHRDKIWDEELAKIMYEELYEELGGLSLTEFNYLHRDGEQVARLFDKVAKKLSQQSVQHINVAV